MNLIFSNTNVKFKFMFKYQLQMQICILNRFFDYILTTESIWKTSLLKVFLCNDWNLSEFPKFRYIDLFTLFCYIIFALKWSHRWRFYLWLYFFVLCYTMKYIVLYCIGPFMGKNPQMRYLSLYAYMVSDGQIKKNLFRKTLQKRLLSIS